MGGAIMLCKAVPRFLVLLVSSLLLPWAAVAADNERTLPIGHIGNNIQPYLRMSDGDGRMSAVPYVIVTVPATQGEEEGPGGIPGAVEGVVSKAEKAGERGKIAAAALRQEKKIGESIGAMVSGAEEISYRKVSGILRDIRKAVKKSRETPIVEDMPVPPIETAVPGPTSMAR